jgi:hypothetical protein
MGETPFEAGTQTLAHVLPSSDYGYCTAIAKHGLRHFMSTSRNSAPARIAILCKRLLDFSAVQAYLWLASRHILNCYFLPQGSKEQLQEKERATKDFAEYAPSHASLTLADAYVWQKALLSRLR